MSGDVFEEHPFRAAFADDPCDLRPKVAGIVGAPTFACGAEGLAGISGEDGIEGPTKGAGIEGSQIVPDWRWGEVAFVLGGNEDSARPILPFDKGAGVISRFGEHEAQIKASAACAEGQSVPGT